MAPGWTANGVAVSSTRSGSPQAAADGSGGLFIAWADARDGRADIYGQHLLADGSLAPGWTAGGSPLLLYPGGGTLQGIVADNSGGFFMGWERGNADLTDTDAYAAHYGADGHLMPGWPATGYVMSAASTQHLTSLAPDGGSGVLLTWYDGRSGGSEIYAMHLRGDGTPAPGWNANGNRVSDVPGGFAPQVVPDGQQGAWIVFTDDFTIRDWIQHVTSSGEPAPGWTNTGLPLVSLPGAEQGEYWITADGVGGAIVVWNDFRNGTQNQIYAQRYFGDGPTATAISLASVNAAPDQVSLMWQRSSGIASSANVYRRNLTGSWQNLGRADFDGSGRFSFVDATVAAGTRYAYRLGVIESGAESFTDESWVDVPAALEFALDGLRPNPAIGELRASFSLARAGTAHLALLDVAGRAVFTRDFDELAPGRHVLQLAPSGAVNPGVYWLRLTQANEARVQKAVVVR